MGTPASASAEIVPLRASIDGLRLAVSVGRGDLGRVENKVTSWSKLRRRLGAAVVDDIAMDAFLELGREEQNRRKGLAGFFVGGHCRDGRRRGGAVTERSLIVVDVDGGRPDLLDQFEFGLLPVCEFECFAYSTRKHTREAPRFRVVIPLAKPVSAEDHPGVARSVARMIAPDLAGIDPVSFENERLYFFPTRCSNGEFVALHNRGRLLDPNDVVPEPVLPKPENGIADPGDADLRTLVHNRTTDLSFDEFASAVRAIKNDERFDDRAEWLNVLAAIHHETNGSEEGFELADAWSRSWTGRGYDYDATRAAWESFRADPSRRMKTGRYVLFLAQRDGWKQPTEVEDDIEPDRPLRATPFSFVDPSAIPLREWLYGTAYIRRYLSVTVAPGGTGKSALIVSEALAMAAGKTLLPPDTPKAGPLRVWLFNSEDPADEMQRRLHAAADHFKLTPDEIGDRLFVDSGRTTPLVIARETREGIKVRAPIVEAVEREIAANRIDVMIVDPFVSTHSVPENDNAAVDRVAKTWAGIAERTGCSIMLIHHVRKGGIGQTEFTADDARGASALVAAARSVRTLNKMSREEAERLGITDPWRFFRVDNAKANLAPTEVAVWRKLASVGVGNGLHEMQLDQDVVGVVEAWSRPDPSDDISEADVDRVMGIVGESEWRENSQAENWIGRAVAEALDLALDDNAGRAKVKSLVKTWLSDGTLRIETRRDGQRKEKRFVVPGDRHSDETF